MKITTIIRSGIAAFVMGGLFGVGLPVKAGPLVWVRTQKLDYFRARGLLPPGSYSHQNKKPATIAVTKARQGIRDQKQTASKSAKRSTQGVRLANADGE
jgi:hypothetical protein